jgi:hypothetical protein
MENVTKSARIRRENRLLTHLGHKGQWINTVTTTHTT